MSNIVEVRGISKRFGDFEALRNVTFDIAPGSIVGLIGPNGAGKTTTL
ncbi:MAG: ATP-binding cassette domain-containing protein, partial [Pseudomonadales bacterium]